MYRPKTRADIMTYIENDAALLLIFSILALKSVDLRSSGKKKCVLTKCDRCKHKSHIHATIKVSKGCRALPQSVVKNA